MTQMAKIIHSKMSLNLAEKTRCWFYKTENYWISFFDCLLIMNPFY